jgi:hypothetical protein
MTRITPLIAFLILVVLIAVPIFFLSLSGVLSLGDEVEACKYDWKRRDDKDLLEKAAVIGDELVEAIKKYDLDHGTPPEDLKALVPAYLP